MADSGKRRVWVVIDVGCHECGVSSVPVGIYATEDAARAAAHATDAATECWRDGGQTIGRRTARRKEVGGPHD